jgi:hypothetical protein
MIHSDLTFLSRVLPLPSLAAPLLPLMLLILLHFSHLTPDYFVMQSPLEQL